MLDTIKRINRTNTTNKSNISKKSNKKILLSLVLLFVTITIAVPAIITIITHQPIKDDYFTSDDTKTTITLTPDDSSNTSNLVNTHLVYSYDDADNVSSLKTYFEYSDEDAARAALESSKDQIEFKGAILEGKYVIVTADESQYKGLTASDIKQQADAIKRFQEGNNTSKHSSEDSLETTESKESAEDN